MNTPNFFFGHFVPLGILFLWAFCPFRNNVFWAFYPLGHFVVLGQNDLWAFCLWAFCHTWAFCHFRHFIIASKLVFTKSIYRWLCPYLFTLQCDSIATNGYSNFCKAMVFVCLFLWARHYFPLKKWYKKYSLNEKYFLIMTWQKWLAQKST